MTVKIYNESFECTKAVKGPDYVVLYDSDREIVRCSGITDFSGYSIEGGEWSLPEPTAEERLAALESAMLDMIMGGIT